MTQVLFLSLKREAPQTITCELVERYRLGWHVVSMSQDDGSYTFVLERPEHRQPKFGYPGVTSDREEPAR